MITPNLTKLIESGIAQYRTWAGGATGSFRIPVPDANYAVITDFTFYHFADRNPIEGATLDAVEALKNCVHHLNFYSYGTPGYIYNIRSSFEIQFWDGREYLMPRVPSDRYDTYQVHKTDIHVDLWRLIDFQNWLMSVSKLDDKTSEPPGPMGYGTAGNPPSQNVLRQLLFNDPDQQFLPYGENQGITQQQDWREQFYSDIGNQTLLHPPDTANIDCNFTYPLLNIGYVLVNAPILKTDR